ncbi:MAG: STAS domain-containing protein [Planctomycetota bacterium]
MPKSKYFTVECADDLLIISLVGSIGALEEAVIRDDWDEVLALSETAEIRHAIIDLGKLEYFGSIVLELLVGLWKRISNKQGKLAICNASPLGREVLHVARFDTIWLVASGLQDAKDAVRE